MKMKYAKVALACLLAMSMSFGVCGCDDKPGSESKIPVETMSPEDAKVGLTFEFDNNGPAVENTENSDPSQSGSAADSVTSSGSDSSAAETVYEEVTEYVPVTDAEGQNVTEAGGAVQTQVVVVETRPVTVTQPAGQDSSGSDSSSGGDSSTGGNSSTGGDSSSGSDSSSGDDPSSGGSGETYTPAYGTCRAYWLDSMKDTFFNGEFLQFTFEVKDGIPDGSYPVTVASTDIASWEEVTYKPALIDGEVAVNATPAAQSDPADGEFTLKVNSVAAKQGDQVTVTVDVANNPGFVGFVIFVQYDTNALTLLEASAGKDFNAVVNTVS